MYLAKIAVSQLNLGVTPLSPQLNVSDVPVTAVVQGEYAHIDIIGIYGSSLFLKPQLPTTGTYVLELFGCMPGFGVPPQGNRCELCDPGSYSHKVEKECRLCPPGSAASLVHTKGFALFACVLGDDLIDVQRGYKDFVCFMCGWILSTCIWTSSLSTMPSREDMPKRKLHSI